MNEILLREESIDLGINKPRSLIFKEEGINYLFHHTSQVTRN